MGGVYPDMQKTLRIIEILTGGLVGLPVFVMTVYNLYRQEVNPSAPPLIDVLPDWHWAIWLSVLLLICLFIVILEFYRNSSKDNSQQNTKTNNAKSGSIALQDVNNSPIQQIVDSFKTSNTPAEFYRPTKGELAYHIAQEMQQFVNQFKRVRFKPGRERFDQFVEAKKFLDETINKRTSQTSMVFTYESQVPALMKELDRQVNSFGFSLGLLEHFLEEHSYYRRVYQKPPQELLNNIAMTRNTLWGEGQANDHIMRLVDQLLELLRQEGR
jgi:hypothetical protein